LLNCPGSWQRAITASVVGYEWKLRTKARRGPLKAGGRGD